MPYTLYPCATAVVMVYDLLIYYLIQAVRGFHTCIPLIVKGQ